MAKKNVQFELTKEKKEFMITSIQSFFLNERDIELGDLAASMVLDFFIEKLAKEFYNLGVADAHQYMSEKIEDLLGIQKI